MPRSRIAIAGVAIAGATLATWAWAPWHAPAAPAAAVAPPVAAPVTSAHLGAELVTAPVTELTNRRSDRPLHRASRHAPGTRIPVQLTPVHSGIPLSDGSFLPLLNGMTWAPIANRDPEFGPLPPVVALVVDSGGFEWWEHADGSTTTCRYRQVEFMGETYWDPASEHCAPKSRSRLRQAPDETPPRVGH